MARTRIVAPTSTNEVHTEDIPLRQPDDIVMPGIDKVFVQEPESIAVIDKPDTKAGEEALFRELKFNEDVLTIALEPSSEENAPDRQEVYCNGVAQWVPVGVEYRLPRKFVEILVRSTPVSVRTIIERHADEDPVNRIKRSSRAKFPLSILHDPAGGRGHEWLRRIRAQG